MGPIDTFATLHPVVQALIAGGLTWGLTAAGAALVFTRRGLSRWTLDVLLGFSGGVMLAASFFSLLGPAIEYASEQGVVEWVPATIGFLLGGLTLAAIDRVLPHLHLFGRDEEAEGLPTTWQRSILLVLAITLHNVPEGLAVGVAFGAAGLGVASASLAGAIALAVGIAIQNVPEGLAVAMPLRREGVSAPKAFLFGQASALVEPVAAVVGAAAVTLARPILPYALAFAAGAMVFVVVEELIPTSQTGGNADAATLGLLAGFALMMTLDVALG